MAKKRGRPRKVDKVESETMTATVEMEPKNLVSELVPEEKPETIVKAPIGDIRAKISRVKVSPKYEVWTGVKEECPYWTVHAGGIDFSKENEIVSYHEESRETRREKVNGKVISLSKEEIDFIAKAVGRKVIRKYGSRASILNTDNPRYTFNNNDLPLGQFLFMKVLAKNLPHDWRNQAPEAMA